MTRPFAWLLVLCAVATVFGGIPPRRRPRPPPPPPSKDTYFISAPDTVIPGTKYSVTVDILNGTNVQVTAALQKKFYNKKTLDFETEILERATDVFSKGKAGRLEIMVPETFKCNDCSLLAQGRGGQVFERSTRVMVKRDILSIFVQTDKAIYKPEQIVRYRAFAVYQDLQIYKGSMSIEIREPSGNRMQIQNGLRDQSGVVEGSLKLSDQPPFGDWSIKILVEGLDQTEIQQFTVAQYELPRFEVTVDLPPFALLHEDVVRGTVTAKYTYGKPVKGMVNLHVGPDQGPDYCGKMPTTVNVGFAIDGEAKFSIPKSNIQRVLRISHGTRVRFTAIVTEDATGVKLNGSEVVQYYTKLHAISFLSSTPNVFKPGLPYTAKVQVKKPDGLPPSEADLRPVTVWPYAEYRTTVPDQQKYGTRFFSGTYPLPKMTIDLPASGIAAINVDIPKNATNIWIKVYFNDISTSKRIQKTYSASNNYIQLTMIESDIKSGDVAVFQVQATEDLESLSYEILSRNSITKVGTVEARGQSTFTFDVAITEDMGPVANLLVYYVRDDGEVVADSIAFNVDGVFKNKVSLDFDAEKAEPNKNVNLKVKADPMSKVYLLAVDESVLLLKSGNDIDTKKVQEAVSSQTQMDTEFALSQSAAKIGQVFSKSGLIVITDASLQEPPNVARSYGRPSGRGFMSGVAMPGPPGHYDMELGVSYDLDAGFSDSVGVSANPLQKVKRVRNKFPEAWLWSDVVTNGDGSHTVNTTVPDTITTWIASAFATNQKSGLGVAATKASLTVFRSFFVSLTYPHTMKRNEQAVIQATVFNYLQTAAYVTVTLKDSSGFKHVQVSGDKETVVDTVQPQRTWVSPESNGVVYFPIVGKEVGVFDIEVRAQSTLAADGVRRQIAIEPEGAPNSYNHAVYIDQSAGSGYSESHSFSFPESIVPGSMKISIGLSGDLIGPSFSNIDHLLTIPIGCGEQNMIRLAPSLYIGKYLKATGQLTPERKQNLVDKLEAGYQSQLSYRRSDASFSAFGNNDQSGSTWLTAYVARVLSEAREFIYVDPSLLTGAIDWLVQRQRDDGAFVEIGRVIDPNTQGKATGPALTAYVLLTLHQNKDLVSEEACEKVSTDCDRFWKWNNATEEAKRNLETRINSIKDAFSMSVVTYALTLVRSRQGYKALRKLKTMSTAEGGLTCWKGKSTVPDTTPALTYREILVLPPRPTARPIDTLITSYALLTFAARNQRRQALPVVKCLMQHKNFLGGFGSTQDTSVGLQALSAYATRAYDPNNKLSVSFKLNTGDSARFDIDRTNMLNYQTKEYSNLPSDEQDYQVEMKTFGTGTGSAVAEINYSFNTLEMPDSEAFDVSTVLLDDNVDFFNLMICTKWLRSEKTGMVVQEIEIPSGFEPDLGTIGNVAGMKRHERRGNMAVVYFDEIVKTSTCYSLLMSRKSKVAKSEKTFVHTFNYYNPEDTSTVFYHPRKLKSSKICGVCPKCCM